MQSDPTKTIQDPPVSKTFKKLQEKFDREKTIAETSKGRPNYETFGGQNEFLGGYAIGENRQQVQHQNQGRWNRVARGFGKAGSIALTSLGEGAGVVLGAIPAIVEQDSDLAFKNPVVNFFSELQKETFDPEFQAYKPSNYNDLSLLERLAESAFWSDEFASGVGFLASALIPQGLITYTGKAARLGLLANYGEKATTASNAIRVMTPLAAVTVGRVSESGIEANQVYDTIIEQLQQERSEGKNNLTNQQIIEEAKLGRMRTFAGNMLLAIPDLVQYKMLFGGFKPFKEATNRITRDATGKLIQQAPSRLTKAQRFLSPVGYSALQESQEENYQLALSNMATELAVGGSDDDSLVSTELVNGILKGMVDNFSDVEGQTSMFLGGLLGGGMVGLNNLKNNPNAIARRNTERLIDIRNKFGSERQTETEFLNNFATLQEDKRKAIEANDELGYKAADDIQISETVLAKLKTDQYDQFLAELDVLAKASKEELTTELDIPVEALVNEDTGTPVDLSQKVKEYKRKVQQAKKVYEKAYSRASAFEGLSKDFSVDQYADVLYRLEQQKSVAKQVVTFFENKVAAKEADLNEFKYNFRRNQPFEAFDEYKAKYEPIVKAKEQEVEKVKENLTKAIDDLSKLEEQISAAPQDALNVVNKAKAAKQETKQTVEQQKEKAKDKQATKERVEANEPETVAQAEPDLDILTEQFLQGDVIEPPIPQFQDDGSGLPFDIDPVQTIETEPDLDAIESAIASSNIEPTINTEAPVLQDEPVVKEEEAPQNEQGVPTTKAFITKGRIGENGDLILKGNEFATLSSVMDKSNVNKNNRTTIDYSQRENPTVVTVGSTVKFAIPPFSRWYNGAIELIEQAKKSSSPSTLLQENIDKIPVVAMVGETIVDTISTKAALSKDLRKQFIRQIVASGSINEDILSGAFFGVDRQFEADVVAASGTLVTRYVKDGKNVTETNVIQPSKDPVSLEDTITLRGKLNDYVLKDITFPVAVYGSTGLIFDGHPDEAIVKELSFKGTPGRLYVLTQNVGGKFIPLPVNTRLLTQEEVTAFQKARAGLSEAIKDRGEFQKQLALLEDDFGISTFEDKKTGERKISPTYHINAKRFYTDSEYRNRILNSTILSYPFDWKAPYRNSTLIYSQARENTQTLIEEELEIPNDQLNDIPQEVLESDFVGLFESKSFLDKTVPEYLTKYATLYYREERPATEVLGQIAKNSTDTFNKSLAKKLLKLIPRTKFVVRPTGSKFRAGVYIKNLDLIEVSPSNDRFKISEELILHEAVHAATVQSLYDLEQSNSALYKELTKLFNQYKEAAKINESPYVDYAATSLSEFVAEAFSNVEVQRLLESIPVDEKQTTLFDRFIDFITSLLKSLGINIPQKEVNGFTEVVRLTEQVFGKTLEFNTNISNAIAAKEFEKLIPGMTPEEQKRRIDNIYYRVRKLKATKEASSFEDAFNRIMESYRDKLTKIQDPVARTSIKLILDNKEDIKKSVEKRISRLESIESIDTYSVDKQEVESDIEEALDYDEAKESDELPDSEREVYERSGIDINPKDKLRKNIERMLSEIPVISIDNKPKVDNIGDTYFEDVQKLYSDLSLELAGITTLDGMIAKLNTMTVKYPGLKYLVQALVSGTPSLKNSFYASFRNELTDLVVISKYFEKGSIAVNNINNPIRLASKIWTAKLAEAKTEIPLYSKDVTETGDVIYKRINNEKVSEVLAKFNKLIRNNNLLLSKQQFLDKDVAKTMSRLSVSLGFPISRSAILTAVEENWTLFKDTHLNANSKIGFAFALQRLADGVDVFSINREFGVDIANQGESKTVANLAALSLKDGKGLNTNRVKSASGTTRYTINQPRKIFNIVRDFNTTIATSPTLIANKLRSISQQARLEVKLFDATLQRHLGNKATEYAKMNKAEMIQASLDLYSNSENTKFGWFLQPTPGDKANTFVFKLPKLTGTEAIAQLEKSVLKEIERIKVVKELAYKAENLQDSEKQAFADNLVAKYHYKESAVEGKKTKSEIAEAAIASLIKEEGAAFKLNLIPTLNDLVLANGEKFNPNLIGKELPSEAKEEIARWLKEQQDSFVAYAKQNLKKVNESTARAFVKDHIAYFTELVELTSGDVSFYKDAVDFTKRYPQVTTNGNEYNFTKKNYNLFIFSDLILENGSNQTEWQKSLEEYLIKANLPVPSAIKNGSAYDKINSTDAQGFMTLARAKEIVEASGKLTNEVDNAFKAAESGTATSKQLSMIGELLLVKKPSHYGMAVKEGLEVPVYVKYSVMPIIPQLIAGNTFMEELNRKLSEIEQQTGFNSEVVFQSGVKVGAHNINGVNSLDNLTPIVLENANWREVVPYSYKESLSKFGSQLRKLILNNAEGEYTLSNGEKLSAEQLIERYDNLVSQDINRSALDFLQELGFELSDVTPAQQYKNSSQVRAKVNKRIAELLQDQTVQNEFGTDMKELATSVNPKTGEFLFPISHPSFGTQFESVMIALFRARTTLTLPGFTGVAVSELAVQDIRNLQNRLKFVRQENGKIVEAEAVVSMDYIYNRFKQLGKLDKFFALYEKEGPEGILEQLRRADADSGVAYRIPTSDKHSMMPYRIKKLLPIEVKTMAILPSEGITQMGYDFDIDKTNLTSKTFDIDDNGNIIPLSDKSKQRDKTANEIAGLIKDVLLNPQSFRDMLTPISIDPVKSLVPKESGVKQTVISPIYNIEAAIDGLTGKALVGIFANHTVANVRSQKTKSSLSFTIDSKYKRLDSGSFKVSTYLSSLLNAATDNAKDPVLAKLGINLYTADVVASAVRLGIPLKQITSFFTRPEVNKFLTDVSVKGENTAIKDNQVNQRLVNKLIKDAKKSGNFEFMTSLTPVEAFLAFKKITKKIVHQDRIYRSEVVNPGPTVFNMISHILDRMNALTTVDEESLTNQEGPFAFDQEYYNKKFLQPLSVLSQMFDSSTPFFISMVDEINSYFKDPVDANLLSRMQQQFYSFIFSGEINSDEDFAVKLSDPEVRESFYRDTTIAGIPVKGLYNRIDALATQLIKEGKDIPYVLKFLRPEPDGKGNTFIVFQQGNLLDSDERALIQESFRQMYLSTDSKYSEIAEDLAYYALASNGFFRTPGGLIELIPYEFYEASGFNRWYTTQFRPMLNNLENVRETKTAKIYLQQFMQNNFTKILRKVYNKKELEEGGASFEGEFMRINGEDAVQFDSYVVIRSDRKNNLYHLVAQNEETATYVKLPTLGYRNNVKEYSRSEPITQSKYNVGENTKEKFSYTLPVNQSVVPLANVISQEIEKAIAVDLANIANPEIGLVTLHTLSVQGTLDIQENTKCS